MNLLSALNDIIMIVIGLLAGFFLKNFAPSYFKQKGKNFATKEDITAITTLQEEVKASFQSTIETQKSELNKNLEVLKLQQNKLLKDYELYTYKRHEYYPQLYRQIELSVRKVKSLRGSRIAFTYENVDSEDISVYMTDKLFTNADKKRILGNWETNRDRAIRDLESRVKKIEYNEAGELYFNASDCFLLNRLFFSEKVSLIANELLDTIYKLWKNYTLSEIVTSNPNYIGDMEEKNEELIEKMDSLSTKLFEQMQNELFVREKSLGTSS